MSKAASAGGEDPDQEPAVAMADLDDGTLVLCEDRGQAYQVLSNGPDRDYRFLVVDGVGGVAELERAAEDYRDKLQD